MPNPERLQILVDLRRSVHPSISQGWVAEHCFGIEDHRSVGAWERGKSKPRDSRRGRFIIYLWDTLRLRRSREKFEEVWSILMEEWGWHPLTLEERKKLDPFWKEETPESDSIPSAPSFPEPNEPSKPTETPGFIGRTIEQDGYRERLSEKHFVVITGLMGAGKTWLASQLAQSVAAGRDIFWHDCREGDDVTTILWRVAEFMASWHEQPRLWRLLHTDTRPPALLLDNLFHLLANSGYLLCLDNLHLLSDVKPLIEKLYVGAKQGDFSVILVSREVVKTPDDVDYPSLRGLAEEDCLDFLGRHGYKLNTPEFELLFSRTDGNPALLDLTVKALKSGVEPEILVNRLAESQPIQRYLLEHIDESLEPEERLAMEGVALLLGYPETVGTIGATLNGRNVTRSLVSLCDRFLLQTMAGVLDPQYFQHAIVQEFYYGLLDLPERQDMHLRAAGYYEHHDDSFKAALHYTYANKNVHAARLATESVRKRLIQQHGSNLRRMLEKLDTQKLPPELHARVELAKGQTYTYYQRTELAEKSLLCAEEIADTLKNSRAKKQLQAQIFREQGFLLKRSAPTQAVEALEKGLAIAEIDSELRADLQIQLANAYSRWGKMERVPEVLKEALSLLSGKPNLLHLLALIAFGKHRYLQGDYQESRQYMQQSIEMADVLDDPFNRLACRINLAALYQTTGEWPQAKEQYKEATLLADRYGYTRELARIDLNSGVLYAQMGEGGEAFIRLSRALGVAQAGKLYDDWITALGYLADLSVEEGDMNGAKQFLTEAIDLLKESEHAFLKPFIYYVQARFCLTREELAQAMHSAEQSLFVAQELGMKQERGMALRVRGEVYAQQNKLAEASTDFESSIDELEHNLYESALTQRVWGQVLKTSGHAAQSQSLLLRANRTFEKLGIWNSYKTVKPLT